MRDPEALKRAYHGVLVENVERKCEQWGVAKVRVAMESGNWQEPKLSIVKAWLARREAEKLDQASSASRAASEAAFAKRSARSANRAAWIAAIAAMIAAAGEIADRIIPMID